MHGEGGDGAAQQQLAKGLHAAVSSTHTATATASAVTAMTVGETVEAVVREL